MHIMYSRTQIKLEGKYYSVTKSSNRRGQFIFFYTSSYRLKFICHLIDRCHYFGTTDNNIIGLRIIIGTPLLVHNINVNGAAEEVATQQGGE